jgi:HSP20 family protein
MTRTIVRWDPFPEFGSLSRAFNRAFGEWPHATAGNGAATLTFPVDVADSGDSVSVKASLPGVKADEVDITVDDGVLTIKGEKRHEETEEKKDYFRREIRYGAFARSVALPAEVKAEEAEAEFVDGVLTVTLPKAEAARPKTIKIATPSQN